MFTLWLIVVVVLGFAGSLFLFRQSLKSPLNFVLYSGTARVLWEVACGALAELLKGGE